MCTWFPHRISKTKLGKFGKPYQIPPLYIETLLLRCITSWCGKSSAQDLEKVINFSNIFVNLVCNRVSYIGELFTLILKAFVGILRQYVSNKIFI